MNAKPVPGPAKAGNSSPIRHGAALRLATIAALLALPVEARAECISTMSPVSAASASPGGATPLRAAMMRASAVPAPAIVNSRLERARRSAQKVQPARPSEAKVVARRSKGPKSRARRIARRSAPARAAAAAAPIIATPAMSPPSAFVQRANTAPASYALIRTTICETGPASALVIPLPASPQAEAALGAPPVDTGYTDMPSPIAGPLLVPLTPSDPPGTILPVAPVPEPGTWAMLIVGFAATGAALRARRAREAADKPS